MQAFDQDYCNDKYNISGSSMDAKSRQKFLPNLFTKATICAGSVVSYYDTYINTVLTI